MLLEGNYFVRFIHALGIVLEDSLEIVQLPPGQAPPPQCPVSLCGLDRHTV